MHLHDLILAIVAFFSEFLGTLSGFGSSTFFVPLALFLETFQFVLALTAILHCFGNLFRIMLFREHFQKSTFIKFAIPSVVFTGIGAMLTEFISIRLMERTLGVVLILVSLIFIFGRKRLRTLSESWGIFLTIVSGFSTGLVGTGGAIRGLALTAMQIPKDAFVMISSSVDIGGDLLRAAIYIRNGFMDWNQWYYLPVLGLAAYGGARLGQVFLSRINQGQFERTVSVFIFLSGLVMVFQS